MEDNAQIYFTEMALWLWASFNGLRRGPTVGFCGQSNNLWLS
jgi:hypothetical protein